MKLAIKIIHKLQLLVIAWVLILFFQGKGSHAVFIATLCFIPLCRFICSKFYRMELREFLLELWAELINFHQHGKNIPWLACFYFAATPMLFLALINGRNQSSGDNLPAVLTAVSLLEDGDVELSEAVPDKRGGSPYFIWKIRDRYYSAYPLGTLVFTIPVFALSKIVGGQIVDPSVKKRLEKLTACLVGAACMIFFFLIILHFVEPYGSTITTLVLASGSVVLSTLTQGIWSQTGVLFWFLLLILVEFRHKHSPNAWHPALQGFACATMISSRLTSMILLIPIALWILVRSPKRALQILVFSLMAYIPWAALYFDVYGNILSPQIVMSHANLWSLPSMDSILGIFFSPARGLFIYQPWLCLLFLYFFRRFNSNQMANSGTPAGWEFALLGVILTHTSMLSCWKIWEGGSSWGSRLMAEVVITGGILIAQPISTLLKIRLGRIGLLVLAIISFWMQANAVYLSGGYWNGDPPNPKIAPHARLWDWSDPPFLYPFLRNVINRKS